MWNYKLFGRECWKAYSWFLCEGYSYIAYSTGKEAGVVLMTGISDDADYSLGVH